MFQAFAMATPGMRELLSIGKVWELAQLQRRTRGAAPYDIVIVDAPATGHGIGILKTPRMFAEIALVGPIAHQGRTIATTIEDRSFTGIVSVATAEEMPVNETLAMCSELAADGLPLELVILNALYPARFDEQDAHALASALDTCESPLARAAVRAALSEHARAATQRAQQLRLTEQLRCRLVELPYLFADELGRAELEQLSTELEAALEGRAPAKPPTPRQAVG
jgi:anion-transporting  ArsA/GET3 family ATPase